MWIRNNISRQQNLGRVDCVSLSGWVRVHVRDTCSASRIARPRVSAEQIRAIILRHSFSIELSRLMEPSYKVKINVDFSRLRSGSLAVISPSQSLAINMSVCIVFLLFEELRSPKSGCRCHQGMLLYSPTLIKTFHIPLILTILPLAFL